MYESPIKLYMTDVKTQLIKQQEEQIIKAVQSVAVGVDHDELFRALKYDRGQYEKGYADAMATIVRCKDCKHRTDTLDCGNYLCNRKMIGMVRPDDFCSFGERKDNGTAQV